MDDLVELITDNVGDWREFARCMNFLESEIRLAEAIPIEKLSETKEQYASTKYALYFIRRFLHQKQDVTSWAFWCNLLNKFDNGKLCIEEIKRSGKITLRIDDLSKCKIFCSLLGSNNSTIYPQVHCVILDHFGVICKKVIDWKQFARTMEFDKEQIEQTQKNFKMAKERNEYFMKMKLKNQNSTWDYWKKYLEMFDEGLICIQEIENEYTMFGFNETSLNHDIDLTTMISKHIKDWKELARLMNFNKFEIKDVENSFANIEERCLHLMKKFVNREQDITSWLFWRNLLTQYEEGKLIIYEVEKAKINFFCQGSAFADHMFVQSKSGVISHQYDWFHSSPPLESDYDKMIEVNIGAGHLKIMDIQKYNSWFQTKQDYYERFSYFQELNTFDFTGSSSDCEILHNFQELLKDRNDKSFTVKGYSLKNHYALFGKTVVKKEHINNTFLVYLENENIFLYVNISEKDDDVYESIHKSLESYQYFQAVHETIQNYNSIFIGVVAFDEGIENFEDICPTCLNNHLFISKNILSDRNALKTWINDIIDSETVVDIRNQLLRNDTDFENESVGSTVKRDILTFQALEQDEYPSFTMSPESQTSELKKLLFLTQVQIAILLTKNKHIVITGGYGSGKSHVLMKKLKQVLAQLRGDLSISKDIFYLICHDRQSKFLNQMELYRKEYPDKTFVCIYPKAALQKMKLSEIICEYTSQVDDDTNVHFFIDEFDGSCFDENEVTKLASMIDQFKDSYIVIANQTLQNRVESKDVGFQYKELQEKANFSWFHLDSSMRCSVKINNFIKETACYLESLQSRPAAKNTYNSSIAPVDVEYALENAPQKHFKDYKVKSTYQFNQPDKIGHNVSCENVSLYTINTSKTHHFYLIYYILRHIRSFDDDKKFVVCFCDELLYNFVYTMMQHFNEEWTSDIQEFLQINTKKILITDYASVRGYEFENFIFILKMNQMFVKFRYVECFSRAMTSLFVIVDTARLAENYCDESRLLEIWKNSKSVSYFKMDYETETDELPSGNSLFSLLEKAAILLGITVQELCKENRIASDGHGHLKLVDKYPWSNIHFDDIVGELFNPLVLDAINQDDVNTFQRNVTIKHNSIDQMDVLETSLENNESLIYKLEKLKGCDPVKIVECLFNPYSYELDTKINKELIFFGSILHMSICNDSLKTTKYLLEKGCEIDLADADVEPNLSLPFSPKMVMLLEKYGLTKFSTFGTKWLGDAFFYDDVQFFEHIVQVNQLNVKTHKTQDWYPLLRLALFQKSMKIAELLIKKYEVDINEQDNRYQKTVLHQAAITDNIQFAELFLGHGADIKIKDRHGNTPYRYAISQKMKALLDFDEINS